MSSARSENEPARPGRAYASCLSALASSSFLTNGVVVILKRLVDRPSRSTLSTSAFRITEHVIKKITRDRVIDLTDAAAIHEIV